VLQIDSLPEQGQHVADAGADSTGLSDVLAADHDRVAEHAGDHSSTHRVRRLGKHAAGKNGRDELPFAVMEKSGRATDIAATPGPKGQPAPTGASAPSPAAVDPGAPATKPDCDPPWYFDAKGIQRAKPICL